MFALDSVLKTGSYEKLLDSERQSTISSNESDALEKPQSSLRSPFFIASTTLVAIIIALSVVLHLRFTTSLPAAPVILHPTTFEFTSDRSLRPFDLTTQEKWEALIPEGWSGVQFREANGDRVVAGIDMWHRLHCLNSIRGEFTKLVTEERHWYTFYNPETELQRLHLGHCFDFIRQDIFCAADAAVEPLDEELKAGEGEGIEHQCRDHSVLKTLVDKYRVD